MLVIFSYALKIILLAIVSVVLTWCNVEGPGLCTSSFAMQNLNVSDQLNSKFNGVFELTDLRR